MDSKETNLLTALRSTLLIGETDIAASLSKKLPPCADYDAIKIDIANNAFADAVEKATKILSASAQVERWLDPAILLLEKERDELRSQLSEISTQKADILSKIREFEIYYHRKLGDKLHKMFDLRRKIAAIKAKADPSYEEELKKAERDYDNFSRSQKKQNKIKPRVELNPEDAEAIKSAYRRAAKFCHPDAHHDPKRKKLAERLFVELQHAYEHGDLARITAILRKAEEGNLTSEEPTISSDAHADILRAEIASLREALSKTEKEISELIASTAWQTISKNPDDHEPYLDKQCQRIEQEIADLTAKLNETEE